MANPEASILSKAGRRGPLTQRRGELSLHLKPREKRVVPLHSERWGEVDVRFARVPYILTRNYLRPSGEKMTPDVKYNPQSDIGFST